MYEKGESFQISDYVLTIQTSFIQNVEPSVISSTLPIRKPQGNDYVESLPYWPRYDAMTPEQRWVYVNWLTDITQPINIGYVFVYYYGLERHLIMGNFEDAVEEILLLQKHHHHKSFLGYSSTALVVAMYARGDFKYFDKLLSHEYACEYINPDILFLAKADRGIKLSTKELMVFAPKIGFANTRYIKGYPDLFERYLDGLLLEYETKHQCDLLQKTDWQKSPKRSTMMFANLSLGEQRFQAIPCITKKAFFVKEAKVLLKGAHDLVKSELLIQRKKNPKRPKNEEENAQIKAAEKEKQDTIKRIRELLINEKLIPDTEVVAKSNASISMSKGGQLEQEGDIVGAIKQFEISIALEFFGFYPYERLIVLYHRYKMYDDEIRVIDWSLELYKRKRYNWDVSKLEARKDKAISMRDK